MSIILEGIDMPKSCRICPLNSAPPNGCLIWTINDIRKDKRNGSCPLIEIVTCGECKYFETYDDGETWCNVYSFEPEPTYICPNGRGERRADGDI